MSKENRTCKDIMNTYRLLSLCAALFMAAHLLAQTSNHPLVGLWQQVQQDDGHAHGGKPGFIKLPVWKVIQPDGNFFIFLIAAPDATCIKTNEGAYTVNSDSLYTEHINGSVTDPTLIGKDNKIFYRFETQDMLHVSYHHKKADRKGEELWIRVKLEVPRKEP